MSKKGGTIVKIVAVITGIVAVGTACYVYKDKIAEFFKKIKLKEKLDSVKSFVTENILGNKEDDFFDDAEFFDDETDDSEDSANRGYTSLTITPEEETCLREDASEQESENAAANESVAEDSEEVVEYENEGLSDVSEDEDVLAEEAALDGNMPE